MSSVVWLPFCVYVQVCVCVASFRLYLNGFFGIKLGFIHRSNFIHNLYIALTMATFRYNASRLLTPVWFSTVNGFDVNIMFFVVFPRWIFTKVCTFHNSLYPCNTQWIIDWRVGQFVNRKLFMNEWKLFEILKIRKFYFFHNSIYLNAQVLNHRNSSDLIDRWKSKS